MSETLHEAVAHLRDLSTQLNHVTDQATAAVRRLEIFLNQECRLGLAVYVTVASSGQDLPILQLGYARCGNRYRIVVRSLSYLEQEGRVVRREGDGAPVIDREEQTAWSECARAVKFDAFAHLPVLLTALQEHVARIIERADQAMLAAQRITEVLGDPPPCEDPDSPDRDDCETRRECHGKGGRHGHPGHHGHHGHHDDRGFPDGPERRDMGWPRPRGDGGPRDGRRGGDRS